MESATSGASATRYTKYEMQLSNDQIRKIKRGIKEDMKLLVLDYNLQIVLKHT